jgi:hypothetical protein
VLHPRPEHAPVAPLATAPTVLVVTRIAKAPLSPVSHVDRVCIACGVRLGAEGRLPYDWTVAYDGKTWTFFCSDGCRDGKDLGSVSIPARDVTVLPNHSPH